MFLRTILLILALIIVTPGLIDAQILDAIDVHLNIHEKTAESTMGLAEARLQISDIGEVQTDKNGSYSFTYPVRNEVDPVISISLLSDGHKMLKPVDGSIQLDATREEMYIDFLVVNMEDESPAFKKRIVDLENKMAALRAKNNLTVRQLNALNNTLVDTILFFEANRRALESEIANYETLTDEQRREISTLNQKIGSLEEQVDQLTSDLEIALEEKYLRQNEYFTNVSSNLMAYLRKAKDLRDHLPFIADYFNSPAGFEHFDKDIKAYNKIWENFDNNRMAYLEGVGRYWENQKAEKNLEEVFDFLVKGIHQNQILTVIRNINTELHKQKPRKAQKIATLSHEDMTVNIRALEKQINRTLSQMRRSI
ncbi:MAG: hypothetical protein HKN87_05380 [Saprospiraceae bacterium]|nr:hypothetical protein [Saprospiraceae bacterium]